MKLLMLLFLAGCAVKCDESKNYVVQMPVKDTPVTRHNDLKVYWNVPTNQCRSKKIPFDDLNQFGIIQNTGDLFRGDEITILYDPGYFPALLRNDSTGELKYRNGGVPQEGNLDLHLKSFASDLHASIPYKNFSGFGIIDFESWRPVFRQNFGEVLPYQSLSIEIERQRHWWWTEKMIKEEAKNRFEESAQLFLQYTIALARKMRPLAKWGYYGYPYCFNTVPSNMNEDCPSKVVSENNQIHWLWSNSTALYPSVYSFQNMTGSDLVKRIRGRVREAVRVRSNNATILPYFSYRYMDGGYFSETDLYTAFDTLTSSEASGVIIWGSSNDVNTIDKCEKLHEYIYTIFGPLVAKYVKSKKSYKPEHHLHDDEKINYNVVKANNTLSPIFIESNDIANDPTTLDPIYDTESTTQKIFDLDILDETTENMITSSKENTGTTHNNNLETTTLKNEESETANNRNEYYYINIEDKSESSTEHTTKDEVQHDDDNNKEESTIKDLNFSSHTTTDTTAPVYLTSDTTIEQVTGWTAILNTIFTIINGPNDKNSTDFETDSESEPLDDFTASTYFETDLLMNNLSDFTLTTAETTESTVMSTTLYSTEETELLDYEFKTTTLDLLLERISNKEEVTTLSTQSRKETTQVVSTTDRPKNLLENIEVTTEYVPPDIDIHKNELRKIDLNSLSSTSLITLISDNTTNINIKDKNISTTDRIEDSSQNHTIKDMLQYNNNIERESKTEGLAVRSTTLVSENWPLKLIKNDTTEIKNDDSTDRIKTTTISVEFTTLTALQNSKNLSTMRANNLKLLDSESESFSSVIPKINENILIDKKIVINSITTEKVSDGVYGTTENYLEGNENNYEEKTENISFKDITSSPESYSAETIKQVAGSAAPVSRLKYIFCVVIYLSVSKCLCDYYGQCE